MLLQSGKIYLGYKKSNFLMCASLQITEGVKVFASNSSIKPESISDMVEIIGFKPNKINSFLSVPRWIAVTYTTDSDRAYENGLVKSPFNASASEFVVENYPALADENTYLIVEEPNITLIF